MTFPGADSGAGAADSRRKAGLLLVDHGTGFEEFKKWALKDVTLPDLAELEERIYWSGIKY